MAGGTIKALIMLGWRGMAFGAILVFCMPGLFPIPTGRVMAISAAFLVMPSWHTMAAAAVRPRGVPKNAVPPVVGAVAV